MSKNNKVRVTGRKGLGKLSGFGVATEMEVRFVHAGQAICLRLNYDELRQWQARHHSRDYEPTIVTERSGSTRDKSGVEIRLRKLHRTTAISADEVRMGLARRLNFIGSKFQVTVNAQAIKPGDRVRKSDCAPGFCWDVAGLPGKGVISTGQKITGWIGFLKESSHNERGVDIFANEKAAELESSFNFSSTHAQFARAHLVGEIHADFLDAKEDLIATARNSVVWESNDGLALQAWGQNALRWAFEKWVELRREEKEKLILTTVGFDRWLETRLPT